MISFKNFIKEAEFRMDAGIQRLEKKFPRDEALKHGIEHMSNHLQKEHGFPKDVADAAAKNHHGLQSMFHKYSGPEYISRDSSD